MPRRLRRALLTDEIRCHFENFDFGREIWSRDVAAYIRRPKRALRDVLVGNTKVWVYRDEDDNGDAVGYGSVGLTPWSWPEPADARIQVALIPYMGISADLRGKPDGPKVERYSSQIITDLMYEAAALLDHNGLLGLFVDAENLAGIHLYERHAFQLLGEEHNLTIDQRPHRKMYRNIRTQSSR